MGFGHRGLLLFQSNPNKSVKQPRQHADLLPRETQKEGWAGPAGPSGSVRSRKTGLLPPCRSASHGVPFIPGLALLLVLRRMPAAFRVAYIPSHAQRE